MIFAVDYDGTIADTNREKARWIRSTVGISVPPWKCSRTACVPIIGLQAYEKMSDYVYERESTLQAKPVPGALEALEALADHGRVYVVSARPWRRLEFAREWLDRRGGLQYISGFETSAEGTGKLRLCSALRADWLIDDDRRHLESSSLSTEDTETEIGRIWLLSGRKSPDPTDPPEGRDGIHICSDWKSALDCMPVKG